MRDRVNLSEKEKRMIKIGAAAGAIILLFSLYIAPSLSKISSRKRNYEYTRKQYDEFRPLMSEYRELKTKVALNREGVIRSKVTRDTFRNAFSALLNDSGLSIQAFEIQFGGTREKGQFKEFTFNIEGKDLTLGETLSLIRRIETGKEKFVLKETRIKRTFESEEYLNVTLKIAVVSAG